MDEKGLMFDATREPVEADEEKWNRATKESEAAIRQQLANRTPNRARRRASLFKGGKPTETPKGRTRKKAKKGNLGGKGGRNKRH